MVTTFFNILLLALFLFLVLYLKRMLDLGLGAVEAAYSGDISIGEELGCENERLRKINNDLELMVEETVALFDITKDICRTLDEEQVFLTFCKEINKYIDVRDCRFLRPQDELAEEQDYVKLPLKIDTEDLGYLAVSGLDPNDINKFHILAQQFLLGIKRAVLYKKVQELAITDSLTQVFSRRYFLERFKEELERSKKYKHLFSFFMIDIDDFKSYNDRYGHLVGDAVLREIAKAIKENIRQVDLVGRYGGEEFSLILPETGKDQALVAAERIRQAVECKLIKVYDEDLRVTISIGISAFPKDGRSCQTIIERADQALYHAKQTGKNKTCNYAQ